jgi:oligoribonuclease NrnB/cAMP/cGMP phosphodiesterase (DHH superfamily)
MQRSGAGLAWDFFHPGERRPKWIDYLEDRDLWRRQLSGTDEFTIALRSYPQDMDIWRALFHHGVERLIDEGHAIQRYYRQRVDELKKNAFTRTIAGYAVPVCNAFYAFASEVAGELAEGERFAACYFEHAHGTTFSLRSRDGGMDVSEIAKQFGGGGHKHAAGFKIAPDAPWPV